MKTAHFLTSALTIASATAFSPNSVKPAGTSVKETFDPLNMADPVAIVPKATIATAAAVALNPLVALAGAKTFF